MEVRSFFKGVLIALISVSIPALCAAAKSASLNDFAHQNARNSAAECPEITGIELSFTDNGSALITWDPIYGVDYYTISVIDENGHSVAESSVSDSQFEIDGLEYGVEYTIKICYICPFTGEPICTEKKTRYVIIEDVIVMFDGKNCGCNTPLLASGNCTSVGGTFKYDLTASKIYNITLSTGEKTTFVYSGGHIRRVGSCPIDYSGHGSEPHGSAGLVEYMTLNGSKIHFHPNYFCIESALAPSVSSCNIYGPATVVTLPAFGNPDNPDNPILTAYPNPFTDVLNVEIPGADTDATTGTLQLFDSRGQLVYEEILSDLPSSGSTVQVNVPGIEPGVYWLRVVRDGEAPFAIRVVKVE